MSINPTGRYSATTCHGCGDRHNNPSGYCDDCEGKIEADRQFEAIMDAENARFDAEQAAEAAAYRAEAIMYGRLGQ